MNFRLTMSAPLSLVMNVSTSTMETLFKYRPTLLGVFKRKYPRAKQRLFVLFQSNKAGIVILYNGTVRLRALQRQFWFIDRDDNFFLQLEDSETV